MQSRLLQTRTPAIALLALLICGRIAAGQDSVQKRVLDAHVKLIATTPVHEPVIMRLDLELELLTREAKKMPPETRVDWLAAGMSPQHRLYQRFGMGDLKGFAKLMLGEADYPHVKLHQDAFADRDLSNEIRSAYAKVSKAFGRPLPTAPIYKVAFGYQKQTNAAMEGRDRQTRRHIVILNRSALAHGDDWKSAIIHETWHTFQGVIGKSLKERSVHEGMATYLTGVIDPTLPDHKLMMWDKATWEAAEANRAAILAAFAKVGKSTDPKHINPFTKLNVRIPDLPAAPDRCGYYVGLLACRAWHAAHPQRTPADLIATSADDVLSALSGDLSN